MQNAYVERFNGSYRRGVLNACLFESLEQVREQTHHWVHDYNHHRPHDSLKKLPPVLFAQKHLLGASPQQVKPKTYTLHCLINGVATIQSHQFQNQKKRSIQLLI